MSTKTTGMGFFEAKYRTNPDPWNFGSSAYELRRYQAQLSALQPDRYRRAFEPGCSVGIFTAQLAAVCDRVIAIDISPTAVKVARANCAHLSNVSVDRGALPEAIPAGIFDLVAFCEIGYYFTAAQLQSLAMKLVACLPSGGTFLAAHWLGRSADHLLHGDEVHAIIEGLPGLQQTLSERHEGFRLQRFQKSGAASCVTLPS